jgi:amino acid transporter
MLVIGFTVAIALLGGTLTAINNGVRISFAMALDEEMPDVLGLLHARYATPYFAVVLLSAVSALIGAAGIIGGLPVLMGIILASNLGAFLLYALLCILTMVTFLGEPFEDHSFSIVRHIMLPLIGLLVNVGIVIAAVVAGLDAGGVTTQASLIALGLAGLWLVVSLAYYLIQHKR